MSDPRLVPERCGDRALFSRDLLGRIEHHCQFLTGHQGMHFSAEGRRDHLDVEAAPMWWGDTKQLMGELAQ